jgi:NADH dehydrogenase [ubiquinone] 1 alpha subcomplex assembly factor 7
MSLKRRLEAQIAADGPLTVAQYMTACLHDPQDGYYAVRPALGEGGDFITAPLVSQMFGELLGLWAAEVWSRLGRPSRVLLVEAGPGDGSLMSDALRAARLEPAFLAAAQLYLVETSPVLIEAQGHRLASGPLAPRWAASLSDVPDDAPLIVIANELLDCLPARQFVRAQRGWAERMVGLDADGALSFGLAARPLKTVMDRALPDAPVGAVVEISPAQEAFAAELGARIARQGGAALLIDYGPDVPQTGDTLQALKGHRKVSPLEAPGEADLTVHADFPAVAAAARAAGAGVTPILGQGEFLLRLGLGARAQALIAARPDRADTLQRQLARLTAPDQMGTLFKALGVYAPSGPSPPGFEEG